jgi:hypothetical protein
LPPDVAIVLFDAEQAPIALIHQNDANPGDPELVIRTDLLLASPRVEGSKDFAIPVSGPAFQM